MSAIRTAALVTGLLLFLLGLLTGYQAIQSEPQDLSNLPGAFAATGGGAMLTLLALWWPRSK